jgi:predicted acyltransferase
MIQDKSPPDPRVVLDLLEAFRLAHHRLPPYVLKIAGGIERVRLLGVLQRIALCYFFAGLIFCTMKPRAMVACCAALLLGYWALMALVPIRDINIEKESIAQLMAKTGTTDARALFFSTANRVTGRFDEGLNLANHLDFQYLPFRKWDDTIGV